VTSTTYQYSRLVWPHNLGLAITADESIPDLLKGRCFVLDNDGEEWAIPSRHAVWLLIPEDQVLKVFLFIPAVVLLVCEQLSVNFAALIRRRSYVHLLSY